MVFRLFMRQWAFVLKSNFGTEQGNILGTINTVYHAVMVEMASDIQTMMTLRKNVFFSVNPDAPLWPDLVGKGSICVMGQVDLLVLKTIRDEMQ